MMLLLEGLTTRGNGGGALRARLLQSQLLHARRVTRVDDGEDAVKKTTNGDECNGAAYFGTTSVVVVVVVGERRRVVDEALEVVAQAMRTHARREAFTRLERRSFVARILCVITHALNGVERARARLQRVVAGKGGEAREMIARTRDARDAGTTRMRRHAATATAVDVVVVVNGRVLAIGTIEAGDALARRHEAATLRKETIGVAVARQRRRAAWYIRRLDNAHECVRENASALESRHTIGLTAKGEGNRERLVLVSC